VWKECIEKDAHRIWIRVNESYHEKSDLIKFLRKINAKPIEESYGVQLEEYLTFGMKIKTRVAPKFGKDGKENGYYGFVIESVKPVVQSNISEGLETTFAGPKPIEEPVSLANIMLLIKGAKNYDEAIDKLYAQKQSQRIIATFRVAAQNAKITFPVL
jgi:hypothetical protein